MVRVFFIALFLFSQCIAQTDFSNINQEIEKGNFNIACALIDSIIHYANISPLQKYNLEFQKEIMQRIRLDFKKNKDDVLKALRRYYPEISENDLLLWENEKSLEMMIIDGQKRYFNQAVPNLFRINKSAKGVKETIDGIKSDDLSDFLQMHIPAVIKQSEQLALRFIQPVTMNIRYTITVNPDVIPEGEIIRCWLPFPRETDRQKNIKLNSVNCDNYVISDQEKYLQRTLYMEKITEKGKPTVFQIDLDYTAFAEFNKIDFNKEYSINKSSEIYLKYTCERPPHIVFTDEIKKLSEQIVGKETNPIRKLKLIFEWIDKNIPWASAREYSTIENIPDYCIKNKHGDCGIQTLLFMTLARYNGVPARWQSGWMMHPPEVNLHDWCEIYIDELGWVPVDQSFGLQNFNNEESSHFYLGGIDSYRLIVNDEYSQSLYPNKIYPRSETVDFQRGELEWRGGNLYFDKWDYNMKVTYLNESEMEK